ncbi:ABC transporter ATP-binding protein [Streptomyces sp. NBC_00576]|uniref:ABC transporter ATP-binding protein n=1 Tax=Streptomyces sp. NBC_00576 TaxID=2903665 RepID=UPI002E818082|nr:ATP-binding cassette domain-containing protein [Streptomyces sp. NBC_00576]WUB70548.1 ATP-binding cassette domain-containing protein [Streptomyces sp. NBC_00576]
MNAPVGAAHSAHLDAPVAEIENLRVEIDGRAIVDGVSFRVLPGRVTALVGASGSGKTTTGLALLGEHPPGARVSGEVRVSGGGPVGYVPQHPAAVLNPARRVGALLVDIAREQVRDLPRATRQTEARTRVLRALADAQLPVGASLLSRYPHQLSGGQQQRVVLAQALLLGARVVVADEPTTGQDALTKSRIVDELTAVVAQGIAVVLLSHDLAVVRALADEVLVMREGRVVESGPTERVWFAPRHEWTRELLAQQTQFTGGSTSDGDTVDRAGAAVLHVRDLTARHHRTQVLRVPELALHAGECLAVVGRSGSGKTTLARCLAGLHRDHDGRVTLDCGTLPRSLRDRDQGQLAAVQYVFQDARAAFDEYRPVVDQVARTAVRLRGAEALAAEAEALAVLAELGLTKEQAHRLPGRLSGGELQRAALARALLARPRVLICDEITSGLDTVTRRGLLDVLAGLRRERDDLSVVLITHDLDTAALADRIAVLDAGEVVEQGPVARVLTAPSHPFTRRLLAATG